MSLHPSGQLAIEFRHLYCGSYADETITYWKRAPEYYAPVESVEEAMVIARAVRDKMQADWAPIAAAYNKQFRVVDEQFRRSIKGG